MTAPLSPSQFQSSKQSYSLPRTQRRTDRLAKSFQKSLEVEIARQEVCDWLWMIFPADSANACADKAASFFGGSSRRFRNYLNKESEAPAHIYRALSYMAKVEVVARKIEGAAK